MKRFFVWGCCVTFALGVWVSSPFICAYANLTNQADNSTQRLKPTALKLASVNFIASNNSTSFTNNNQAKCPEGTTFRNGVCLKECSATTYPHTTKPDTTSGEVIKCLGGSGVRYAYSSCYSGWTYNSSTYKCDANACSGYWSDVPLSTDKGEYTSCKSGSDYKYKYTKCYTGWTLSSGQCNASTCDANTYPYDYMPTSNAGTIVNCKTGDTYKYGYSACNDGWDKSNGYCTAHTCDANTYPYGTYPDNGKGTVAKCKTTTDYKYGYSACNTGWTKDSSKGICNDSSCNANAYPYDVQPDSTMGTVGTCKTGYNYKYGYTACNTGWTKDSAKGICNVAACTGYSLATCPTNGTCATCQKARNIVYKLSSCATGWKANSGSTACVADCSAYPLASCPANGNCTSCVDGSKFKLDSCASGWTKNSDSTACNESSDAACKTIYQGFKWWSAYGKCDYESCTAGNACSSAPAGATGPCAQSVLTLPDGTKCYACAC